MYRVKAFVQKWPLLTCVIVLGVALYFWPSASPPPSVMEMNAGVFQGEKKESAKVEDASSAFVKGRLSELPEIEYKIYAREFYTAFVAGSEGGKRQWQTRSGFGTIAMGEVHEGAAQTSCRSFSERYTINGKTQILHGIACHDEQENKWCKLRANSTPTCRLNNPGGLGMFFENANTSLHNFNLKSSNWMRNVESWF